jgi:hypothetical protein
MITDLSNVELLLPNDQRMRNINNAERLYDFVASINKQVKRHE